MNTTVVLLYKSFVNMFTRHLLLHPLIASYL